MFTLTRRVELGPAEPAYVELTFEAGVPVALNGVRMSLVELIGAVATIAGHHGVGRVDMVENRLLGIKSREVHEAPAAVVLHAAHRDLQAFVTTRELDRIARGIWAPPTPTWCTTASGSPTPARRWTRSSPLCSTA